MPDMPPLFRPVGRASRGDASKEYDRRRRAESLTRPLYGTARWRAVRDDQLAKEPFCRMCRARGDFVEATVCDHVRPHNGDVDKFWAGPFQSLCETDHNQTKQASEAAARAADQRRGWRKRQ